VVGAVESDDDDDDDEMVVEDKVEEAAFDLKREQIAFINILPYRKKKKMKTAHRIVHFSLLSPSPHCSGKFLSEMHPVSWLSMLNANNIHEEENKKRKRRRRILTSSLAPTN
jgi:hypothetical protein